MRFLEMVICKPIQLIRINKHLKEKKYIFRGCLKYVVNARRFQCFTSFLYDVLSCYFIHFRRTLTNIYFWTYIRNSKSTASKNQQNWLDRKKNTCSKINIGHSVNPFSWRDVIVYYLPTPPVSTKKIEKQSV